MASDTLRKPKKRTCPHNAADPNRQTSDTGNNEEVTKKPWPQDEIQEIGPLQENKKQKKNAGGKKTLQYFSMFFLTAPQKGNPPDDLNRGFKTTETDTTNRHVKTSYNFERRDPRNLRCSHINIKSSRKKVAPHRRCRRNSFAHTEGVK